MLRTSCSCNWHPRRPLRIRPAIHSSTETVRTNLRSAATEKPILRGVRRIGFLLDYDCRLELLDYGLEEGRSKETGELTVGGRVVDGEGTRVGVDSGLIEGGFLEWRTGSLAHDDDALHQGCGCGSGKGVGHDDRHVKLDTVLEVHSVAAGLHAV